MFPILKSIKENLYEKAVLPFANYIENTESKEYEACSFELNDKKIIHRLAKITPTKTGQFVTIWKRNEIGITEGFSLQDDFDFIIITCKAEEKIGQFIFSKAILQQNKIIGTFPKPSKRGIRVYPNWDVTTAKQAKKTQEWQKSFFIEFRGYNSAEIDLLKKGLEE